MRNMEEKCSFFRDKTKNRNNVLAICVCFNNTINLGWNITTGIFFRIAVFQDNTEGPLF